MAALLRERGIPTLDELITILVMGREPSLATQVVEALLNNETYFFRDRVAVRSACPRRACPNLPNAASATSGLSIWSAGCSTGQEAYSLAMLFAEDPVKWAGWTIDILGTDISERRRSGALAKALIASSKCSAASALPQMIRWFEECGNGWRAIEPLRRMVRFQVQNLLEPPPHPGTFDIVLCRNVLLYLNSERRAQVFDRIANAMAPDGSLMMGAGETVIGQTRRLEADPEARGLYRPARRTRNAGTGDDRRTAAG